MNRNEIAGYVADRLEINMSSAQNVVQCVLEAITQSLTDTGSTTLRNFGLFRVCRRKARAYRVPSTGQLIQLGEKNTVVFKPAKHLKEAVK